jgi:hypothetical protein
MAEAGDRALDSIQAGNGREGAAGSAPAVIGLAAYPTPDSVRIFVNSFRAHRRESCLYLLVDGRHLRAWRSLDSMEIRIVPIRTPWMLATERRIQFWFRRGLDILRFGDLMQQVDRVQLARGRLPFAPLFETAHTWRMRYQYMLVRRQCAKARWICLTDTRDFAFQDDFERAFDDLCASAPLHVFEEIECLGSEGDLVGAPIVRILAPDFSPDRSRPIICVGTVVGTASAQAEYLRRMLETMAIRPGRYPRPLDQGALNLLYYSGRLDDLPAVAHPVGEGGILHLAGVRRHSGLQIEDTGATWRMVRPAGVHQFDRIRELEAVYEALYG